MNILHIGKFYPPFYGGMENYLRDLAVAQIKQGHEVTVWVHNHDWQKISSKSTFNHMDKVYVIRQKSLKPILFTPVMLGFGGQLSELIDQQRPDVIHLHWPNPSLFKLLWQRSARNIPWVISWHADMVTEKSSRLMKLIYGLIKPLETRLIKRAASLLVSTKTYAMYSKQLSRFQQKTKVIPLGMDTAELNEVMRQFDPDIHQWTEKQWQGEQLRLFHLGRLTFYKNQSFLISVMQSLPEAQLLIAGEGQLQQNLQQQITQSNLTQQVSLLGALSYPKAHAILASCEVFCMASDDRAESFGVVLLEAMYHDKIILVPDTAGSGMQWLAMNYHKGFIYKVNNPGDFIEKLQHIQQNYQQISQQPKQFNYSIECIADRIEQHYHHLLTVTGD